MKRFYAIAHRDCGWCPWLVKNVLYSTEQAAESVVASLNHAGMFGGMFVVDVCVDDVEEGADLPEKVFVNIHWVWGNDEDEYHLPRTGSRERVAAHQVEYEVIHG